MNQYFPIIELPRSFREIKHLRPQLPPKPREPLRPQMPVEPQQNSGKRYGIHYLIGLVGFFSMFTLSSVGPYLFTFILFYGGIMIIIGISGIVGAIQSLVHDLKSYPQLMEKYQIAQSEYPQKIKNYERELEDYRSNLYEYNKEVERLSQNANIKEYQQKFLNKLLLDNFNSFDYETPDAVVQKGISEDFFRSFLIDRFDEKIITDIQVLKYFPDYLYVDQQTGLIIDIEIDEPYVGFSGEPIHWIDQNLIRVDQKRDKLFLSHNIVIVRFAEEQIFKQPEECVNVIESIIEKIYECVFSFPKPSTLTPIKIWSKEESNQMGFRRHRHSYIPHEYHKYKFEKERTLKANTAEHLVERKSIESISTDEIMQQISQAFQAQIQKREAEMLFEAMRGRRYRANVSEEDDAFFVELLKFAEETDLPQKKLK